MRYYRIMDGTPKRKLTKIRTFADDMAEAKEKLPAAATSELTTPDTAPEPAIDTPTEPTTKTEPIAPATSEAPTSNHTPSPPPTPKAELRRADDFLKIATPTDGPPARSAAAPTPVPTVRPATSADTLGPTPTPTAAPTPAATNLTADIQSDLKTQAAQTPVPTPTVLDADNDLEAGSIITDKKRDRFKLLPAIMQSLRQTAHEVRAALTPKPKPQNRVTPADSRRDVITTAAKQSYNIPDNDFVSLKKAKTSQSAIEPEVADTQNVQIKAAEQIAPTDWSHYTDEAQPSSARASTTETETLDEETVVAPAAQKDVQTYSEPEPEPEPEKSTVDTTPVTTATPTADSAPPPTPDESSIPTTTATDANTAAAWIAAREAATVAKPSPAQAVSNPTTDTAAASAAVAINQVEPDKTEEMSAQSFPKQFADPATTTRHPWFEYVSRFAIVFVILGAVGLGTSTALFWFGNFDTDTTDRVLAVPSLIPSTQQLAVPLGNDRGTLLTQLAENTKRVTELIQFYPVYDIESDPVVPANSADVLETLAFRIPGNLQRNITTLTLGTTNDQQPFLIMRVQNFDTTFAGLLAWEAAMSADLAPWFGDTVVESFDPNARTTTQLRQAFFADSIQNNINLRILTDENRNERITYGFITPQLVLITTTSEAFKVLKDRIQQ